MKLVKLVNTVHSIKKMAYMFDIRPFFSSLSGKCDLARAAAKASSCNGFGCGREVWPLQAFAFVFNSVKLNNSLIMFNENSNKQRREHIYFIINTMKVGCVVVLLYAIFGYLVSQSVSVSQVS